MNDMTQVIELVKTVTPELLSQGRMAYIVDNIFGFMFSGVGLAVGVAGMRWARKSADQTNREFGTFLWAILMLIMVLMFAISIDSLLQFVVAPDVCAIGVLIGKFK